MKFTPAGADLFAWLLPTYICLRRREDLPMQPTNPTDDRSTWPEGQRVSAKAPKNWAPS